MNSIDFSYFDSKEAKVSRVAYITFCMFEYFITLMLSDMFLSKLLTELNVPAALQGVISSVSTFAFSVEIFAVLLIRTRSRVKRWVTVLNITNQMMLSLLYFTPFFPLPEGTRPLVFVILIVAAYLLEHVHTPFRTRWLSSNIRDDRRGIFGAINEMFSLVGGVLLNFGFGAVLDYYEAKGDSRTFFIIGGIALITFTAFNLVALLLSHEPETVGEEFEDHLTAAQNFRRSITVTLGDKTFLRLLPLYVLYYASAATYFFFGVYKNQTLGFSMTFNSVILLIGSAVRVVCSIPIGKLADRRTWSRAMTLCYILAAISYGVMVFTVPENGKYMYIIFYVFYSVALSGMNSGATNICFDYIKRENLTDAFAWKSAIGGVVGLIMSVIDSAIVTVIEKNGNTVFGIPCYPQQFLSVISLVLLLLLAAYTFFIIGRMKSIRNVGGAAE